MKIKSFVSSHHVKSENLMLFNPALKAFEKRGKLWTTSGFFESTLISPYLSWKKFWICIFLISRTEIKWFIAMFLTAGARALYVSGPMITKNVKIAMPEALRIL